MLDLDGWDYLRMGSANVKGDVGEVIISSYLRSEVGTHLVRNIYLPYEDKTTEIDMLWLTSKGIFCIECKNYSGSIRTDFYEDYWKVEYSLWHTEKLFNPIKQNMRHTSALAELLESYNIDIEITPVVVFTDKVKLPNNAINHGVFIISQFIDWYRSQNNVKTCTSEVLGAIYTIVSKYSDVSDVAKIAHTINLHRKG